MQLPCSCFGKRPRKSFFLKRLRSSPLITSSTSPLFPHPGPSGGSGDGQQIASQPGVSCAPHAKSNASRLQLPCYHNVFIAGFPPVLFILSSLCIQHKNTFAALEVWGESRGKYRKQRGRVYRFFFCCSLRGSEESEPGSGPKRQVEGYLFKGKGSWAWATQKHGPAHSLLSISF